MKRSLLSFASLAIVLAGCGGSGGGHSSGSDFNQPTGKLVTDNPTDWSNWAALQAIPADSALQVRVCDHGTDVYERPVVLRSTTTFGTDEVALIEPTKYNINGPGDSGSPVLYNGKIVGSIIAGDDSQHLYARSIEQQMDSNRSDSRGFSTAPRIIISTPFATMASKVLSHYPADVASRYVVRAISGQADARGVIAPPPPPVPPIAGRKYAATYLDGPDISEYVMATFTMQLPDGKWLATGHSIGNNGPRGLPVRMAFADGRLQDGSIWAHPFGLEFATLTHDSEHGSVIESGNTARFCNVETTVTIDGVSTKHTHRVTLDGGSDDERISSEYGLVGPLYYSIGDSQRSYGGQAHLILKAKDGTETTLNYADDPFNGKYEGSGGELFYDTDFWVFFALYDNLAAGKEIEEAKLIVKLKSQ